MSDRGEFVEPVKAVRVVLVEDADPKVYDAKTGDDVSNRCHAISIYPGQWASAEMFHVDEEGSKHLDPETRDPLGYRARVLSIRAEGVWSDGVRSGE